MSDAKVHPGRVIGTGLAMGLADLVPGVSGGTIAFISGLYDRLINALNVCASLSTWVLLLRGQFKVFWKATDAAFLLRLAAGVFVAVVAGAGLIRHLLNAQPVALLAFFFGLTLAAAVLIVDRVETRTAPSSLGFLAAGLVVALIVATLGSAGLEAKPAQFVFFAAGFIAFSAMLLPGISGSLILLLLGVYPFLIEAVDELDFITLLVFMAGGAAGVLSLIRLLRRTLDRHHDRTVMFLCGLMLGSLPKLWPWKETEVGIRPILNEPVWPWQAEHPQYLVVTLAVIAGAALIASLHRMADTRR